MWEITTIGTVMGTVGTLVGIGGMESKTWADRCQQEHYLMCFCNHRNHLYLRKDLAMQDRVIRKDSELVGTGVLVIIGNGMILSRRDPETDFDGKSNADVFIDWLNRVDKMLAFKKCTGQRALQVSSGYDYITDWEVIRGEMMTRFILSTYKEESFAKLQTLRQSLFEIVEIARRVEIKLKPSGYSSLTTPATMTTIPTSATRAVGSKPAGTVTAQRLISLCGWEPRLLPYVVDCNGSKSGVYEAIGVNDEHQSDPASVVLDCKLCGASVGLWAFSTVSRPLELFRLVESSDGNDETDTSNCNTNANNCITEAHTDGSGKLNDVSHNGGVMPTAASLREGSSNLCLSIGQGPPPAKQNFRATISLPIVSRHLRASLIFNSGVRDHTTSNISFMNRTSEQCDLQSTESFQHEKDHMHSTLCTEIVQSEDMELLKQKSSENDIQIIRNASPSCLNHKSVVEDSLRNNLDLICSNEQELPPELETCADSRIDKTRVIQLIPHGSGENNTSSQIIECLTTISDDNGAVGDWEVSKDDSLEVNDKVSNNQHKEDFPETDVRHSVASLHESLYDPCCLEINGPRDISCEVDVQIGLRSLEVQATKQRLEDVRTTIQLSVNKELVSTHGIEKDPNQKQVSETMEFDPIRQHRHFCPWIISIGSTAPGWQQTLFALDRVKEPSHAILPDSPSSLSTFEIDDPIASIRKLFMSPSTKKVKATHGLAQI
ncbi:hypothetical protein GIB67_038484 [Kingdonia uniflora]|uniref:Uncharacterized protein n=1 Tax=Kingdonia uniflora TaxID=39325 RepID=A0A7J7NP46_9MAGN|nr:hypothetical protein GIB67_038484 [Kingdonia uniflora]